MLLQFWTKIPFQVKYLRWMDYNMSIQGGREKNSDEEVLVGVDVIFQAENVLQPSVMLQAYHLLQVRLQMFKLLFKQLSSQEVKTALSGLSQSYQTVFSQS